MKLFLKIVFMIVDWVLYFAFNLFCQFLFVLFGFWFGFMGGVLAQRMNTPLADELMAIFGAIWFASFIGWSIVKVFFEKTPNHANTIAQIKARLGFAPRTGDNQSDIPF